jgi:hypothetical protein
MKTIITAASLTLFATMASAQTAEPQDWITMRFTADINKSADMAWQKVGGDDLCALGPYIGLPCANTKGTKLELGAIRTINNTLVEYIVARTKYSYTYAQANPSLYHGTMEVEPLTPTTSRLVYTLIWNQTPVGNAAAQAAARASRQTRFQAAVDNMAAAANGP